MQRSSSSRHGYIGFRNSVRLSIDQLCDATCFSACPNTLRRRQEAEQSRRHKISPLRPSWLGSSRVLLDYKMLQNHTGRVSKDLVYLWNLHACMLSCFSCVQLCDLWTVARQAPLSIGFLQTRILESDAMPSSRGSSQPRDWICISYVSCIGGGVLYS